MNETVRDYCQAEGIAFTRCRPYRKNDQAWVEQKNGAVVRRIVGCRRFEGLEAAAALARSRPSLQLPGVGLGCMAGAAHQPGHVVVVRLDHIIEPERGSP